MRCTPKNCCPDFDPLCKDIMPTLDLVTTKPTPELDADGNVIGENQDGSVYGFVNGLVKKWFVEWEDGTVNITSGNISRSDLSSGKHTIVLTSLTNPNCIYVFDFEVPKFTAFQVELYYKDMVYPAGVVGKIPNGAYPTYPSAGFPYDYRWNDLKRIKTSYDPTTGTNTTKESPLKQCYVLTITGGTTPYTIKWRDYTDVGTPPFVVPANINTSPTLQPVTSGNTRPPLITSDKTKTGVCVSLVPKNGNGWITVDVSDSSSPANSHTIWLYIKQDIFP